MIIKKMTASFGALEGRTLSLSEGLNVLYAPNESGKSTWCAFVRTMLYGLDTSQRARAGKEAPDKLKYRPWSGAPMSGSMELETRDGPVTLRRWTERASRPMQAFSATRTGTDLPVPDLASDTAGQSLTGMPRQVFERSVFIRQTSLALTNDPELDRRLGAIVSSGDESVSCLETQARLLKWQRRRSGRRGAIPELQQQIDQMRRGLADIRRHQQDTMRIDDELDELAVRRTEAADRLRRTREERRERALSEALRAQERAAQAQARRDAADGTLREADGALDDTPYGHMGPEAAAARAQEDIAAAEELTRAAERRPKRWLFCIPLGLAALAFALAFTLPAVPCVAAGVALALLAGGLLMRLRGAERTRQAAEEDRARLLARCGVTEPEQIAIRLDRYRELWRAREAAARAAEEAAQDLADAEAAQDLARTRALDGPEDGAGGGAEDWDERIDALRRRRAMAEAQAMALGDPMAMESALAEAEGRLGDLLEQDAALTLALEALAEADARLQQRFSPALARTAAGFFSDLTGGRYDEITLARDLTARARPSGDTVGRELDYLSSGAQDQLYLSLRLALCTLLPGQEDACPIILDDALAAFDAERMARALELLAELSRTRQILLFTCHEREYRYFDDVLRSEIDTGYRAQSLETSGDLVHA